MVKKGEKCSKRRCLHVLIFLILCVLLSTSVLAGVQEGSVTLEDIDNNASSIFNFSAEIAGSTGHFHFDDAAGHGKIVASGNTELLFLGFWDADFAHFTDDFPKVPFQNYSNFFGTDYGDLAEAIVFFGDAVSFAVPDGSGDYYYGAIYVNETNPGDNVTLYYKYNNQSGNATFSGGSDACTVHVTFDTCLADVQNGCEWDDQMGLCELFDIHDVDLPPPECSILPKFACDRINDTICTWNGNAGSHGRCQEGPNFNYDLGFNCSNIINDTVCNNQPFTERTGLCSWDSGNDVCQQNNTKTFDDIPPPPVFFCEAPGYVDNQTNCEDLANTYFMPCGWNNDTSRCADLFFDFGKFDEFEDISSQSTCQSVGGTWRDETTFDPINQKVSSESWCEFGVAVKTFENVGGGGQGSFSGPVGQFNDCSIDCVGCEFNSTGGAWENESTAQAQCESSAAGCLFRSDSNAFNGYGWCEPATGLGDFNCEQNCGDCNLQPSPQSACQNSPANCRWDNVTSHCIGQGVKGCGQDCTQCFDQTSCQNSFANGGSCEWESDANYCYPEGGSFEICFDGVDNDNDGFLDCADFKCASDPFCGGGFGVGADCFQYDIFTYGSLQAASGNCSGADDCKWYQEDEFFGYCGPVFESCFTNISLQFDQSACNSFNDGDTCVYDANPGCGENETLIQACVSYGTNESGCTDDARCGWSGDFCESKAFVACDLNQTLQDNETACMDRGCIWIGNQFEGGHEGGHGNNCVSPCSNSSISAQGQCEATGASDFAPGTCNWQPGFCEPKNFIGGCIENDGDYAACTQNSNCNWFEDLFGPLKDTNGSTDFNDFTHPGAIWLAIGLNKPIQDSDGTNESNYTLTRQDSTKVTLVMTSVNVSPTSSQPDNISRIYCNDTIVMQYNFTSRECDLGSCNEYNNSYTCGGNTLQYYFNNVTQQIEALWEVPIEFLVLDQTEADINVTDVQNASTIIVDGNLTEHIPENATADDETNATRVRTSPGFCDDTLLNSFFQGMEENPPEIIATDAIGDADVPYLDATEVGVKKTPEAYMYGMLIDDLAGSAMCKGIALQNQNIGAGQNKSKFFLYLDTDGADTGSCSAEDDTSIAGFEYRFKYIVEINSETNKISETFLSQSCKNGAWSPSNIPFKSDKKKSCSLIGGPIFGIDKDTITSKTDVNTSVGWRAYATTAGANGNASNINDSAGPGTSDFRGIDVELIDCTSTADKDNAQCSKFKQFGFFPGEFGPACADQIDNDGDGLTDCSDFDCAYDPFFCSGSFGIQENDNSAPSIVWTKINKKLPNALTFIFDTNEPSNGTVRFYGNDSSCSTINETILDKALIDGNSLTNYRPHHVAEIAGLSPNVTYYYKLKVCDPSNNCAVSKCKNATTSSDHVNITFKMQLPENWSITIPSLNLTNYSLPYALKASTELLNDMNITIHTYNNDSAITFVGMDIFEKQTLNVSDFVKDDDLVGFDANQYQSFKQKTGLEKTVIKIPASGSKIEHCDEEGNNCQEVTSSLDCEAASDHTECEIPDAVGLGFSTYKASTPSSSSSSSGGGSSGSGSGGGGGGTAVTEQNIIASISKSWNTISAGSTATMKISDQDIGIREIKMKVSSEVKGLEVTVSSLKENPRSKEPASKVFEYLDINAKNVESNDLAVVEFSFRISKAWLNKQKVSQESISLYRYKEGIWQKLNTEISGTGARDVYFVAQSPGFSSFAIAGESDEVVEPEQSEQVQTQSEPEQDQAPPSQDDSEDANTQETSDKKESNVTLMMVALLIIVVALIIIVINRIKTPKPKIQPKQEPEKKSKQKKSSSKQL